MNKYFYLRPKRLDFLFEGLILMVEDTVLSAFPLGWNLQKSLLWVSFSFESKGS